MGAGFLFMISLKNVTFRYPSAEAPTILNLNLEIDIGESVCIMGGNGSGKSTLAALIAGLVTAERGRITVEDTGLTDLRVGLLFQNPDNQFVAVVVEKEIAFGLENLGIPPNVIGQKISSTLDSFSISQLRNSLTAELSGGEKQRVALASIMALDPHILILDEPDSYLDQTGKQALERELERLRKQFPMMSEIRITQYPHIAKNYARLVVLSNGQIAADDSPREISAGPAFCEKHGLAMPQEKNESLSGSFSLKGGTDNRDGEVSRIELRDVSFGYPGGPPVFEDLNLDLRAGEILGIVGSSGAGKTSLGHLICGLLKQTGGSISYFDKDHQEIGANSLSGKITGVFQFPERQFFLPTCIQELHFGPKNLGWELPDDSVRKLFDMVDLDCKCFSYRDPVTLSVGEKRRLAFATVLAMSPSFILFDEPTCGLDQAGVGMFVEMARQLKQKGTGLVIISHDGDVISRLADRLLIMTQEEKPRLVSSVELLADSDVEALLSAPETGISRSV